MKHDIIYKTSTSFVVELKENGYFSSEQEHEIYVNGSLAEKSDRNVATVFNLTPGTTYDVKIQYGDEMSEEFKVTTQDEYVTLNVKDLAQRVMEKQMIHILYNVLSMPVQKVEEFTFQQVYTKYIHFS